MMTYFPKPGALQACREGSASFHPHLHAPAGDGADRRPLRELGNVLARQDPQGFIPSVSSSRTGNSEPGKQRVPTTSHRVAWPPLSVPGPFRAAPASLSLHEHHGVNAPDLSVDQGCHLDCGQTLPFLLTPPILFSRQAFLESDVPTSLPARPGQNKTLCVCKRPKWVHLMQN